MAGEIKKRTIPHVSKLFQSKLMRLRRFFLGAKYDNKRSFNEQL